MAYFDSINALENADLEELAQQWVFNNREPQGLDTITRAEVVSRYRSLLKAWQQERAGDRTQEELAAARDQTGISLAGNVQQSR